MDKVFLSYVFFFGITRTGLGLPVLTCNDVDPMSASSLRCTCHNPGGPGIEWYRDGTYLTQCTQLDGTCFPSGGYTFAADSATFTYTIDVNTYSYTDCSNISCSDLTATSDIELKTILVDESNLNSTNLTIGEPSASHTNGYINFTTDCLYKSGSTKISVSAKWTAVTEKGNHTLEVDDTISEIGSCQSCRNDFASKYFIEFYHKEDQTKDKQEAHILLELFIDGNPVSSENSMTNNMYYVRVESKQTSWCIIFDDEWMCILLIVLFVVFLVAGVVQGCSFYCKQKPKPEDTKRLICLYIGVCISFIGILFWCLYRRRTGYDQLEVLKIDKDSITVRWKRCDAKVSTKYILRYSDVLPEITIRDSGGIYIEYTIRNLSSSTYYQLNLKCIDQSRNVIKKYRPIDVRTYGVPEAPRMFKVEQNRLSNSIITVTWEPLLDGGKPQTFILICSATASNISPIEIEHKGEKTMSYTFIKLSEGTEYDLELLSKNAYGLSERIEPIKATTLGSQRDDRLEVLLIKKKSITVRWKKCDIKKDLKKYILQYSDVDYEIISNDNRETDMEYTIQKLSESTDYHFNLVCIDGANEVLKRYEPINVRTYGVPEAPSMFRVERSSVSESSIMVTWVPMFNGGKKQTFMLTCSSKGHDILPKEIKHTGEKYMAYTFTDLSEGTYYDLELRSKNDNGLSARSQPIRERTLGKPDPPTNLSAENVTAISMTLKWKKGFNGGYPQWFQVYNLDSEKEMSKRVHESKHEGNDMYQCNVINLTPSTKYKLKVSAENKKGTNDSLVPLNIRTNGKPDQPGNFECKKKYITPTSIHTQWTAGSNGGYQQHFFLDVLSGDELVYSDKITDDGRDKPFRKIWSDLKESTDYVITLYAKNVFGETEKLKINRRTKGIPNLPKRFQLVKLSISSIAVQWTGGSNGGSEQTFVLAISGEVFEGSIKITDDGRETPFSHEWLNLKNSTEYTIELYAKNEYGESKRQQLKIRTQGKPDPPTEFRVADVSKDSITVIWGHGYNGGYQQTFYVVVNKEQHHEVKKGDCEYVCSGLSKGTYYNISLMAHNIYGDTYAAKSLRVRTLGPPVTPTEFEMDANTESTITMKWKPGDNGGDQQHFILRDIKSGKILAEDIPATAEKIVYTFFTINKLPKGTKYQLQVLSKNKYGTSETSSHVDVRTKGSPFPNSAGPKSN